MRLFAGAMTDFVREVDQNNIAKRLESAFLNVFRFRPSPAEFASWNASLGMLRGCMFEAELEDNGVILELQLPRTSCRLDALLTGRDISEKDNAVVVELKQWQRCTLSDADDMVSTWVGGSHRDVLHPSVQAGQYRDYLADMNTAFHEGDSPIELSACSYLHNYQPVAEDPLEAPKFNDVVSRIPFFGQDDSSRLATFLHDRLRYGGGIPILNRIDSGEVRPSKKLLEHIAAVIDGESRFVLLDEQKVVFERAICEARKGIKSANKRILLVRGGPGTGKSVLAANLLGKLSRDGLDVQYATGSKAFTESMRSIVGRRAAIRFKYFNNYTDDDKNAVDVLVCDEAHRIREKSENQYTPKEVRARLIPQVDELINAAKVSVFFIDDQQVVRPGEVGSADLIRQKALQFDAELREFQLEAQFRCDGSDGFVNWIDNTLSIRPTANQVWNRQNDSFDFRIFGTVEDLDAAIREKASTGASARLVAGFCWPWSRPTLAGELVDDVQIGAFQRPWNARPEATKLRKGIPKSIHWAIKPEGIEQVGCVYTAQGFEFDYVGVIWGNDLWYSHEDQSWVGDKKESHDSVVKRGGERFAELIKNTYRVLLSRGLKGCYLYCQDPETAKFLLSRTEGMQLEKRQKSASGISPELMFIPEAKQKRFQNCIPVYDLSFAASQFGDFQLPDLDTVGWVPVPVGLKPTADLFVAKVYGESMNRLIPNGAWCVFRTNHGRTSQGKVVVAQVRDHHDEDSGSIFTIKRLDTSSSRPKGVHESKSNDNGAISRTVQLIPDSDVFAYVPLEVPAGDDHIRIVAEFVQLLEPTKVKESKPE
jgi:DUF2075 family protein